MSENEKEAKDKKPRGCAIALVAALFLGAVVAFVLVLFGESIKRRGIAAGVDSLASDAVEQLELPEGEAADVQESVEMVTGAFARGELTRKQAEEVARILRRESRGAALVVMRGFEQRYLSREELGDEAALEGRERLRRFMTGIADGAVPPKEALRLAETLQVKGDGADAFRTRFRERLDVEELESLLDEMDAASDAADVPDDAWFDGDAVDVLRADVRDALERVLGRADDE